MESDFVSIIIPHYNNSEKILSKSISSCLSQDHSKKEIILIIDNPKKDLSFLEKKFGKKIKIIQNKENLGLAGSLNKGIKISNAKIVITLLEDCVPKNSRWVTSLLRNFRDSDVVAVSSKVKNDERIFKEMDPFVKDLMEERREIYSPLLDEKGCAYRKSALKEVGFFDQEKFKTAGEDWDMYFKLSKVGRVVSGNEPFVTHMHPMDLDSFYKRSALYSRSSGVLAKVYGLHFFKPRNFLKFLFPFWGIFKGLKKRPTYSGQKVKIIGVYIKVNYLFLLNFTRGYFKGRQ